jgi:hypothetical protein
LKPSSHLPSSSLQKPSVLACFDDFLEDICVAVFEMFLNG